MSRRVRAGSRFELVAHEQLSSAERSAFDGLKQQPGYFGLLLPRSSQLGRRAVDEDTAALLTALRTPQPLCRVLDAMELVPRRAVSLVLDNVLELESEGGFVSGRSAHPLLLGRPTPRPDVHDSIATISLAAIERAERSQWRDAEELSRWLYAYGRLPRSPHRARQIEATVAALDPSESTVIDALARVERDYQRVVYPGWWSWRRRAKSEAVNAAVPTLKLYISPAPQALIAVVEALADVLAEEPAAGFKLGQQAAGLLRPDKIIVYFDHHEALNRCAARLKTLLAGVPAHGVPFSASLTQDGLLSWGVDPPANDRIEGYRGVRSWRLWLTDHLARSLMAARLCGAGAPTPAWQYALDRLALDGVQPHSYLPDDTLWRDGEAACQTAQRS